MQRASFFLDTSQGLQALPWGSSESAVIAKLGKPVDRDDRNGGIYLSYRTPLLGNEAITTVLVDAKQGLIKGLYGVEFGPGEGCESVFRELKTAIAAKYPQIKPEESRYNNSSLDFCGGVSIGKAGESILWTDPSNSDAQIGLMLKSGSSNIQVHYESPSFGAWSDERKKSDDRF